MNKILLVFLFTNIATANEVRVYDVPIIKPGIAIGTKAPALINVKKTRADQQYYVGLSLNGINYDYASLVGQNNKFKEELVGIKLAHKNFNELLNYQGFFEFDGEWQRYKREFSIYSQRLDLLLLNGSQNFELARSRTFSSVYSMGIGAGLVVGSLEQSIFSNSALSLGGLGFLRLDLVYLFKENFEIAFGFKEAWGSLRNTKLNLSSLSLGVNFE